jgi:hypothetical protein
MFPFFLRLLLGLASQDGTETADTTETVDTAETLDTTDTDIIGSDTGTSGSGTSDTDPVYSQSLEMTANENGSMSIIRPVLLGKDSDAEEGTWTIFVYMCGADLESEYAAASYDIMEMKKAATSDRIRFVVMTGGSEKWHYGFGTPGKTSIAVITDNKYTMLDYEGTESMGSADTLSGFLTWGVQEYPADHMAVILWDHGGGSISGICFDEIFFNDSLSLAELDSAFFALSPYLSKKLDFIGLDACIMSTFETAAILSSYADYMIGSQEVEYTGGWDYSALAEHTLSTDADGASCAKTICDSFYDDTAYDGKTSTAAMAAIDLSKTDALIFSFNSMMNDVIVNTEDPEDFRSVVKKMRESDNFGGNNDISGYTNMIDLGGVIEACDGYSERCGAVLENLFDCVYYSSTGELHGNSSGLSVYFPLKISSPTELMIFEGITPSPYYLVFLDRYCRSSHGEETAGYDTSVAFTNRKWNWGETGGYSKWSYINDYIVTGSSPYITFKKAPHLDEKGNFTFTLDEEGMSYTSGIYASVLQYIEEEDDIVSIGETYDVGGDDETGEYWDYFDGTWLSLPDGQNLCLHIFGMSDEGIYYISPVELNNAFTYLIIHQGWDDDYAVIEGTWNGLTDFGAVNPEGNELSDGDLITPLYEAQNLNTDEEYNYVGETYVYRKGEKISYMPLAEGTYYYMFTIEDIYGDYFDSDFVVYEIDEDGTIWYDEY